MSAEQSAIAMQYYIALLNRAEPRQLDHPGFTQAAWQKAEQMAAKFEQEVLC